ncbi:MAG: response regulator [Elusimicrobiales bacterium]|nr:response regulator [Elusimicrobiales bacterium]
MRNQILLVDDDGVLRSEFRDFFHEYDILEAASGPEALAIIKKPNEVDLVLLDCRMPGMDGLTVLARIKEMAPDKRVIMITGFGSKETVIAALRAKADNFIEKPFDIEKTRFAIEKELEYIRKKNGAGKAKPDSSDDEDKIARVKRFLERNVLKKTTLSDAAAAVHLSPKYLSRIFRERAKTGFNDYKLGLKIKEARRILVSTSCSVKQAAAKLGYESSESFIRQFKKLAGVSPLAYRRKMKERNPRAGGGKKSAKMG